jgi:hypothetical protein
MLTLKINATDAQAYLARVLAVGGRTTAYLKRWGNAVAKEARDNARAKGGKSFWRQIAAATRVAQVDDQTVSVANWHIAGAQKQYGGTITAKNAKALTIPITDEAKRKRASEFTAGGRVLFVPKGTSVLGYADDTGFHALFVLRKSVTQKPEPWFPDAARVTILGDIECNRYVQELLKPA